MESAPLNLAHFHERRADRHLKRNRFDEAIKAMETALVYIEDAYKTISIPEAVQVLDAEKWNCSRKLKQINMRRSQHESSKITLVLDHSDNRLCELPESATMSINRAIEKHTPSTLESLYCVRPNSIIEDIDNEAPNSEPRNWMEELNSKDLPTLAPLELPTFDLGLEGVSTFEKDTK